MVAHSNEEANCPVSLLISLRKRVNHPDGGAFHPDGGAFQSSEPCMRGRGGVPYGGLP